MNSLPGNQHADALKLHQDFGNMLSPTVQATLALAFEQRTANLIAITNLRCVLEGEGAHLNDETEALFAERFGLSEDS